MGSIFFERKTMFVRFFNEIDIFAILQQFRDYDEFSDQTECSLGFLMISLFECQG
jgi:hypothetical protein